PVSAFGWLVGQAWKLRRGEAKGRSAGNACYLTGLACRGRGSFSPGKIQITKNRTGPNKLRAAMYVAPYRPNNSNQTKTNRKRATTDTRAGLSLLMSKGYQLCYVEGGHW